MRALNSIERCLAAVARTTIRLNGRRLHAFQFCGCLGLGSALVFAAFIVQTKGLSYGITAALLAAAVLTFFGVAIATKLLTGEERLVYYHHEIAITASAYLVLKMLHRPVLPYLDLTVLCIGLFLAFGRLGCLMVGCCHGRPAPWGIRYRAEHAAAGFPRYLVGVRLFPIQAAEALWVLVAVAIGALLAFRIGNPGDGLSWYVVAYGVGRFLFEFLRGDAARAYWAGLSQPQWISLLCLASTSLAELAHRLPMHRWHFAATALLGAIAARTVLTRGFKRELVSAAHLNEIARVISAIDASARGPAPVRIATTSLGVSLSGGAVEENGQTVRYYSISHRARKLTRETATALARVIIMLAGVPAGAARIVAFRARVYHVVLRQGAGAP